MIFRGKPQYHKDANNGWENFSNGALPQHEQQDQRCEDVQEVDEWAALRNAASQKDLKFRTSHGWLYVGREAFHDNEAGVDDAWEYVRAA